jgi:hypothetical protein
MFRCTIFLNVAVPLEYVPPVTTVSLAPVLKPLTLNVPPVLFLNTAVPLEYVPPVTTVSLATVLKPLTLNVPLFLNTAVPWFHQ